jgi:hypothetical protein
LATPSQIEISKVQKKLDGFLKKLNPDGSPKRPMDDNLAKQLMRKAVRDTWLYSPTKLAFLLRSREIDSDPKTRRKWKYKCAICDKYFALTEVNADHIKGEIPFTEWSGAQRYAASVHDVTFDDLQILCIPDHKTKSRCEALGLDWTTPEGWNQGLLEQEFTKIVDSKAKGQKDWLLSKGVEPMGNEEQRKIQIRQELFKCT